MIITIVLIILIIIFTQNMVILSKMNKPVYNIPNTPNTPNTPNPSLYKAPPIDENINCAIQKGAVCYDDILACGLYTKAPNNSYMLAHRY